MVRMEAMLSVIGKNHYKELKLGQNISVKKAEAILTKDVLGASRNGLTSSY